MTWQNRMNLALNYVERNLCEEISLEQAAKVAACSKYHFHRVFYSYFEVTFAEYVRRRKFSLAAAEVISGQESILNIAIKYGYDSPNAFTRAFRNIHGISPSQARTSQVKVAAYPPAYLHNEPKGNEKVDYKIVQKPAFTIIGRSKTFEFDDFAKNGQAFWKDYVGSQDYKDLCRRTRGRPGCVTVAPLLTAYFPKEHSKLDEFVDVLGVENLMGEETGACGFEAHSVPSATYAEFECSYRGSMKTNRYIYGEWFSATGYQRDGNKPDVVAYFPMPYSHFSEMGVRWWIPVIKNEE